MSISTVSILFLLLLGYILGRCVSSFRKDTERAIRGMVQEHLDLEIPFFAGVRLGKFETFSHLFRFYQAFGEEIKRMNKAMEGGEGFHPRRGSSFELLEIPSVGWRSSKKLCDNCGCYITHEIADSVDIEPDPNVKCLSCEHLNKMDWTKTTVEDLKMFQKSFQLQLKQGG